MAFWVVSASDTLMLMPGVAAHKASPKHRAPALPPQVKEDTQSGGLRPKRQELAGYRSPVKTQVFEKNRDT